MKVYLACPSAPLTPGLQARNNSRSLEGLPDFIPPAEEHYQRLQSQGGRRVGTGEQDRCRSGRKNREGDPRIHQIPERRSRARGAPTLHQGLAHGQPQADGTGRLYGATKSGSEMKSRRWRPFSAKLAGFFLLLTFSFSSGCGHSREARVDVPPPPPASEPSANASRPEEAERLPGAGTEKENADLAEPAIPADAKPLATETGLASWYGPPYHNRRGSNGEVYNMHAMTAAHRTLPLGSIVRVTNLKTGNAALVRITDRGPFVRGRIIDLSLAAARKVDLYRAGVADVKVEVMQTPAPLDAGGKWAVQIGGFPHEEEGAKLADHLTRRYRTANVKRFSSPAGDWWVRVRVADDNRERAKQL